MDDLIDVSVVLLMASVHKMSITRSDLGYSTPCKNVYLGCKLDTLRVANETICKPAGFSETMVNVWIVGCLMNTEVGAAQPRVVWLAA